jgi:protein phosphatase
MLRRLEGETVDKTTNGAPPTFLTSGKTDRGKVREKNEDAFVIAKLQRTMLLHQSSLSDETARWFTGNDEGWVIVVADGMGGLGGGHVASATAVQAIVGYVCNVMPSIYEAEARFKPNRSLPGVRAHLSAALVAGDAAVRTSAARGEGTATMGTTLTLAYMLWTKLYVAHVGDSRCYLLRDGQLERLTTDHTVAEQLIAGGMDLEASSSLHHVLWNSLGAGNVPGNPEIRLVDARCGDRILLCTDGLTKHVSEAEIRGVVESTASVAERCELLVSMANDAGGSDNVTVVIGEVACE